MKKVYLLLLVCLCICLNASADKFSYLYIQGDKQTPFYVKLEDAMQPRYGKNYCILPQLAPGPVHIEILFQQNTFPSQQFTILMPDGGCRGFLLVKKDSTYSLYDLQQGFYLEGGNKEEDDRLPAVAASPTPGVTTQPIVQPNIEPVKVKQEEPSSKVETPVPQITRPANNEPEFIRDLELTKTATETKDTLLTTVNSQAAENPASGTITISNSDCPTPMSSADFGKVFNEMSAFGTDEDRLEYINGKMNNCYASWQARTLAGKLGGDAARFSLLKRIYPRITDQAAFPLLDDLLTTDIWRAEFARIVHP
jgi:hypothetical protein